MKNFTAVWLCEEDILNLKNAEKRLFDTINLIDQYEPLEIFTIQGIIKQYKMGLDENQRLDVISSLEMERILNMQDCELNKELISHGLDPEKEVEKTRGLIHSAIKKLK